MPNDATATLTRTATATAAIAAVLATTAACGGGGEASGQGDSAATPTSSSTSSSSPTPDATSVPSLSESPSEAALAEPEDGTDLASCADAECEIRVREGDEIPLGGTSGLDHLVVSAASPDRVGFEIYAPGYQMGATEIGPPFSEEQAVAGFNGVQVYVYGADEDGAVIRLTKES